MEMAEMNEVLLTLEPLDVNAVFSRATLPSTGATSFFIGTTRDNFEGKKVLKLEYEAYEPMAIKEMNRLCEEIRSKWDVAKIIIHHRLGEVDVTQPSVIIAISSPHRKESLEAVNYGIERLKETVPIWKKEKYAEGGGVWKENKECFWRKQVVKRGRISVDQSQILIQVGRKEIDQRIQAFILIKQEEKNKLNCLKFCNRLDGDWEDVGCARTVSTVRRRAGTKSQLGISTLNNSTERSPNYPEPLENRFAELEDRLYPDDYKPVDRTVYSRLKALEERVLQLESLAPEYAPLHQIKLNISKKPSSPAEISGNRLSGTNSQTCNSYELCKYFKPSRNCGQASVGGPCNTSEASDRDSIVQHWKPTNLSHSSNPLSSLIAVREQKDKVDRQAGRRKRVLASLSAGDQPIEDPKKKMKDKSGR